ncbi:MAG: hypothetical protein ACRECX_02770 [Methyloceanibacter sp.]|uniref:hypothetical protein n=1 Tax=Methyloceanibacter sp. TaxID=1965321 RepID=UPI003D6D250A
MKYRGLVLVLCGAAGLALLPASASAFEIQGEGEKVPGSAAEFYGLNGTYTLPKFDGYSLAMPYSSSTSTDSSHVSDYGNSIPIPAPGISQPAPAYMRGPFR